MIKGTYRNIRVAVEYSKMVELFIPYGAPAEEMIEERINEIVDELPADVDGFGVADFSYEEF